MDWDYPYPFTLPRIPQAADIDGLNHTNNAVYVRWCEQAGWAHSEALGLTLDDYRRLDRAMAIRRGEYDYLLPTFAGEALLLGTWLVARDGNGGLWLYQGTGNPRAPFGPRKQIGYGWNIYNSVVGTDDVRGDGREGV